MTASHARVLERIFAREIDGQMWQGRMSKALKECIDEQFCEPCADVLGGGLPVLIIKGYMLTHRGRIAFGEWCSAQMAKRGAR